MSFYRQKKRKVYQDSLVKSSTTTVGYIDKVEDKPNADSGDYHELMKTLPSYLRLLTTVVGSQSAHTWEVVAISLFYSYRSLVL